MLQILAHRGLWKSPEEKNSLAALALALRQGFGLETDVRDCAGELVISHDPPRAGALSLRSLLEEYKSLGATGTLALNIKADGLAQPLRLLLAEYGIPNYFVFDMSVPDTLGYARDEMPFFTRHSEFETVPALLERSNGIWLDAFQSDWYNAAVIEGHLQGGKQVCVVSPELHRRSKDNVWRLLRQVASPGPNVLCCTDFPEELREWMK
ncbi:MAG: hypothetical protein ACKVP0_12260 [Pirellulaceae bacterium]